MSARTLFAPEFAERPLQVALGLGKAALEFCEASREIVLVSSLVEANAWVLGTRQRQARHRAGIAELHSDALVHRCTSGNAARFSGRVLQHALALPSVSALEPDATWATLLNRNLRGFIRGYSQFGAPAQYFGRETLCLRRQPFALCGFQTTPTGAVLIELFVGLDTPCAAHATRGQPIALGQILGSRGDAFQIHERVESAFAAKYKLEVRPVALEPSPLIVRAEPVHGGAWFTQTVPMGVVEAHFSGQAFRIFGDLLCPNWALDDIEERANAAVSGGVLDESVLEPLASAPLLGAEPADILAALRRAHALR